MKLYLWGGYGNNALLFIVVSSVEMWIFLFGQSVTWQHLILENIEVDTGRVSVSQQLVRSMMSHWDNVHLHTDWLFQSHAQSNINPS